MQEVLEQKQSKGETEGCVVWGIDGWKRMSGRGYSRTYYNFLYGQSLSTACCLYLWATETNSKVHDFVWPQSMMIFER